eukprot:12881009-Prorocentrum_lima.AAC.1
MAVGGDAFLGSWRGCLCWQCGCCLGCLRRPRCGCFFVGGGFAAGPWLLAVWLLGPWSRSS